MKRILLLVAVLSGTIMSLGAQSVVQSQLNYISSSAQGEGLRLMENERTFSLNDDRSQIETVNLQAGVPYRIYGVCDQDCEDLDLILRDAYGNEIVRDQQTDDVPIITASVRNSGPYQLEVKMYECTIEPCGVGIAVYAGGGSGGNNTQQGLFGNSSGGSSSGSNSVHHDQVVRKLADVERNNVPSGYSRFRQTEYFWLDGNEEVTIQLNLNNYNQYSIWGACDDDCEDLDMYLTDAYGNEVDSDVLTDAIPLIDPSNPPSGPYTLRVKMYDCNVEPCRVGVTYFSR
ncbi:MAG: hypothetical protein AAF544_10775 [Bacteroidota bacterium]